MVHSTELIVKKYFELKGYFVQTNVKYKVKNVYSDIDLVIYHPKKNEKAIVEVKSWFSYQKFTPSIAENENLYSFLSKEAIDEAKVVLNCQNPTEIKKYFVVHEFGPKYPEETREIMKKKGVEIIEFRDILKTIIEKTDDSQDYGDNEIQQLIRIMKYYDLIKLDSLSKKEEK